MIDKKITLRLSGKNWLISGKDVESEPLTVKEMIKTINLYHFVVKNPDCLIDEIKKQLWNYKN